MLRVQAELQCLLWPTSENSKREMFDLGGRPKAPSDQCRNPQGLQSSDVSTCDWFVLCDTRR